MLEIMAEKLRRMRAVACAIAFFGLCAPARAADNWVEVRSPHFTVASSASEKEARFLAVYMNFFWLAAGTQETRKPC